MKTFILGVAATLALSACATTSDKSADGMSGTQLSTDEDMKAVVGRTLVHGPGQTVVLSADGKITGSWDGKPLAGSYEMRDGYFCRTLSAGPRGPAPEDCQLFVLDGNTLTGTRDRGNGATFTYTVS